MIAGLGGVVLIGIALLLPSPEVTAVRTVASVRATLSKDKCLSGQPLKVSFLWRGHTRNEELDAPSCDSGYTAGQQTVVFVASNDPRNLGPTADWILNPDEHDPFDFVGPNGSPPFLGLLGAVMLIGGAVLGMYGLRFWWPGP